MESNLFNHKPMIDIAKWSIVLMIMIIPIQILVFALSPIPDTAVDMIELFIEKPILGLIHMDLLYVINNTLLIFFYIILYITLKKENKNSWLQIAMITGMIGIVLYYTSNRSIEMLYVSQRYAETTNSMLRTSYLVTAESYMDIWKGSAFNIYYVLSAISLIIFSVLILKSSFYSKATGIVGLISGILMVIPSSVGMIGMIFSIASLIPWIIFSVMVVIQLFKLRY